MSTKFKVISVRFIKTFAVAFFAISGAAFLPIYHDIVSWSSFGEAIKTIFLAGTVGGVAGIYMAGDKLWRWEDTPNA